LEDSALVGLVLVGALARNRPHRAVARMQFAQPSGGHGVPGFTLFPMSTKENIIMFVSDSV
jgi:hypothetical protein